jgi:hypothetical protein
MLGRRNGHNEDHLIFDEHPGNGNNDNNGNHFDNYGNNFNNNKTLNNNSQFQQAGSWNNTSVYTEQYLRKQSCCA